MQLKRREKPKKKRTKQFASSKSQNLNANGKRMRDKCANENIIMCTNERSFRLSVLFHLFGIFVCIKEQQSTENKIRLFLLCFAFISCFVSLSIFAIYPKWNKAQIGRYFSFMLKLINCPQRNCNCKFIAKLIENPKEKWMSNKNRLQTKPNETNFIFLLLLFFDRWMSSNRFFITVFWYHFVNWSHFSEQIEQRKRKRKQIKKINTKKIMRQKYET